MSLLAVLGKKLQPGQTYEWTVYSGKHPNESVSFQVMEAQQRDRITTELRTLEHQLQTKGANFEAIALAKANYFAYVPTPQRYIPVKQ